METLKKKWIYIFDEGKEKKNQSIVIVSTLYYIYFTLYPLSLFRHFQTYLFNSRKRALLNLLRG